MTLYDHKSINNDRLYQIQGCIKFSIPSGRERGRYQADGGKKIKWGRREWKMEGS